MSSENKDMGSSAEETEKKGAQESASEKRESSVYPPSPLRERRPLIKGPAVILLGLLGAFLLALVIYLGVNGINGGQQAQLGPEVQELSAEDSLELNIFYPLESKVALEKRTIRKVTGARNIADAAMEQYIAGPSDEAPSFIPSAVDIVGVYFGEDKDLYIDFTSAMTLNFQGGAVGEYLLLRSIYKTINENVPGVRGIRLLVDGREVDTVGGHIYILDGLQSAVPYKLMEEDTVGK